MGKRWMLALCLGWLTLAWADASLGSAVARQREGQANAPVPTVSASNNRPSSDLRESERIELLSTEQRGIGRDQTGLFVTVTRKHLPMSCGPCGRRCWADLVQCRRLAGAQVVRYANPPPRVALA